MEPPKTADEALGLLDSVLQSITRVTRALREVAPPPKVETIPPPPPIEPVSVPERVPRRDSALIPMSELRAAQALSQQPKRRKRRERGGRRAKTVEIIYRRPWPLAG